MPFSLSPDLLAVGFLVFLAMLMLGREIVLGGSLDDGDIVQQSIPVYSWYSAALRQGYVPIWSPDILGGFPLAFTQYGFFYPPDMALFRILDAARAFHLSLSLHLALAGACTYWYCRVLGLRRVPSLLAAVAFQMGNEALSWAANGFITRTLFVMPSLLAIVELLFKGRWRYWLLAAIVVGAGLLGGYAQIVLFALVVAAAYALVAAASAWKAAGSRRVFSALGLLTLGVAAGFGLAAIRVAPTLAVTAQSVRVTGAWLASSSAGSIRPSDLVTGYILPAILELSKDPVPRPDYLGGPVLLLAAFWILCRGRLERVPTFHVALAGVAMVLSLGSFTPFYGLLLRLPFFGYFRGPNRISLIAALAISVVAAYGLNDRLSDRLVRQRKRYLAIEVTTVVGAIALFGAVAASGLFQFGRDPLSDAFRKAVTTGGWDALNLLRPRVGLAVLGLAATPLLVVASARNRISHSVLEWFALALTVATLAVIGWLQTGWLPPTSLYEPPALLQTLKADPDRPRVFAWAPNVMAYNLDQYFEQATGRAPSEEFRKLYVRQFMSPNIGMLFGIATADGYEALQSRRQALLTTYLGSERREKATFPDGTVVSDLAMTRQLPDRLNLLAAVGVKYLLCAFKVDNPALELVGETSLRVYPDRPDVTSVYLYRLNALPRAFVVPSTTVVPSEEGVLETLTAGTANLHQAAILEEPMPVPGGSALTVAGSKVEITDYRDDRVEVDTRTDGTGVLVLMDFLLPGWTATVDGQQAPMVAANFAGRAVPIPGPGEHRIVFRYEAPLFRQGLLVSLVSVFALAASTLGGWILLRRDTAPEL